jgi:hypothetical protein
MQLAHLAMVGWHGLEMRDADHRVMAGFSSERVDALPAACFDWRRLSVVYFLVHVSPLLWALSYRLEVRFFRSAVPEACVCRRPERRHRR